VTTLLHGGRVIDPEMRTDRIADVLIDDGQVAAVGDGLVGDVTIDVTGLVVAPGFIDIHSHAHTLPGRRLQACDGVTTSLDLEGGRAPIDRAYAREARHGAPINYGFSASWAAARMAATLGVDLDGGSGVIFPNLGNADWQKAANPDQLAKILDQLSADLAAGGIGIGLLWGLAPGVDPSEYLAVAQLASEAGVPTFTHCRDLIEINPDTAIDGAEEIARAAGDTGVHAHFCHINSSSNRHIDRVHALIHRCRAEGGRITTEAYPYGSGSVAIGAAFLAPERLHERGLTPSAITYLPTGERVADKARLRELRETSPGGAVIIDFFDESKPEEMAILRRSLTFPDAIVASDGMPPQWPMGAKPDVTAWPLPPEVVTHPRVAGCFARALRLWREEGTSLVEALRRCTILPAQVLEASVPAMRTKGRLQRGADADIVVFDEATITDQATYTDSTRTSTGIAHVLVDGTFVVRDGELVLAAFPGNAIRAEPR
jgi:dihydroorotase-like cyclic amidohydrolase